MKISARGVSRLLVEAFPEFTRRLMAASICCAMLLLAAPLRAEPRIQPPVQSISPATAGNVREWGSAVAVDGNTAMIGGVADEDIGNAHSIVEVYVRHRSGKWVHDSTIVPPIGFSENIALRGNLALITDDLTVHVYRRIGSEWRHVQAVSNPVTLSSTFGRTMALDEHTAVIASFITNSAFVYRITRDGTLEFQQQLTADVPSATFARSVAVEGNTIFVGVSGDLPQGSVYVYERFAGEWHPMQKLVSSQPTRTHGFGETLALDGRVAVIDSSVEDNGSVRMGAAYVFVRSGGVWIEQQRLTDELDNTGDPNGGLFGSSVAIDNGHILVWEQVGAGEEATRRVLHFERIRGEWTAVAQFSQGPGLFSQFGASIALSHGTAFIGAPALLFPVGDVLVYDLHQGSRREW